MNAARQRQLLTSDPKTMDRTSVESDINFNSKRPGSETDSVRMLPPKRLCWKNRWKIPWAAGLLFVIVLVTNVSLCQENSESGSDHPDRDFENIAPASKEIITNHIPSRESGGRKDESRYEYENELPTEEGMQFTEISGDVVLGEKILRASESPYSLRTDLEVERRARLIIEPGVTIYFAPMVGITVRGSLVALVSCLSVFLLLLSYQWHAAA